MNFNSTRTWFFLLVAFVFLCDLATKQLALQMLSYGEERLVFSWLSWLLIYNKGAAFSFLAEAGGWQTYFLLIMGTLVSVVLVIWAWRIHNTNHLLSLALAFVVGGACGNLIDRAYHGFVVDFIALHYQEWYWPAFNIADMAISLGAVLLLWDNFFHNKSVNKPVNESSDEQTHVT